MPVFVIEDAARASYSTPLDAAGEREALAELVLLERDPEAYLTRAQARERRAAEACTWRART